MRRANKLVGGWMREAGMKTRTDAIGNLIGHYAGQKPGAKILLLGSHLDTVRNAGKFDGPLGVILAIACVEQLHRQKIRLPFAIEVVGFADEEGVRYQTAYLGSKVLAGCFDERDLRRKDADGISMADAIKRFGGNPAKLKSARLDPKNLLGYVEAHIEQGPVLEQKNLAVGIVSAIAGQTRACDQFLSGAPGTLEPRRCICAKTPCARRRNLFWPSKIWQKKPAASSQPSAKFRREPGAGNVIPGKVRLSLDVRHAKDVVRKSAYAALKKSALQIARRRKLKSDCEVVHETASVICSETLSKTLGEAVKQRQGKSLRLPSGAGHDAAVMAGIVPAAMLFIRCKNGISHHPDESVKTGDVQIALETMTGCLLSLAKKYRHAAAKSGNFAP